jgi:putative adhesin
MKLLSLFITILLAASLALVAPSVCRAQNEDVHEAAPPQTPQTPEPPEMPETPQQQQLERTTDAASNVIVTVCLASGDVIVHGWDRSEVHASTTDAQQLELQRGGAPKQNGPATRVEVVVSNAPPTKGEELTCDCSASSDIELDVPRGATVQIKTNDGSVEVMDVADARVDTLSGDINVRGVSKRVEASSVSGDVSLENSSGPIRLRSISGSVEASHARTIDATDDCEANTVSGDVSLAQISHAHVQARTISGSVTMKGPLARGGLYDFKTTSGDMLFTLPDDASFRISARIPRGEIITDFTLKDAGTNQAAVPNARLLIGTHGTGDATLDLYSFSGTVRLRRDTIK